jgi:hypothetical protein
MFNDVEYCFKDKNNLVRATVVKSFKYAATKETDAL